VVDRLAPFSPGSPPRLFCQTELDVTVPFRPRVAWGTLLLLTSGERLVQDFPNARRTRGDQDSKSLSGSMRVLGKKRVWLETWVRCSRSPRWGGIHSRRPRVQVTATSMQGIIYRSNKNRKAATVSLSDLGTVGGGRREHFRQPFWTNGRSRFKPRAGLGERDACP